MATHNVANVTLFYQIYEKSKQFLIFAPCLKEAVFEKIKLFLSV